MPANSGVASLVPQVGYHPAGWPPKLWYMSAAPLQAPLIERSGTPRWPPTTLRTPFWNRGRANTTDFPPPLASGFGPESPTTNPLVAVLKVSFQTVGGATLSPAALRCSWVPPTPVTSGSLSGHDVTGCR